VKVLIQFIRRRAEELEAKKRWSSGRNTARGNSKIQGSWRILKLL